MSFCRRLGFQTLALHFFPASDYTIYPFSTQNPKDFQNLLSVYLDATFFPCLRELDFWYVMITYRIRASVVCPPPWFIYPVLICVGRKDGVWSMRIPETLRRP
jgi:hypothetical protein